MRGVGARRGAGPKEGEFVACVLAPLPKFSYEILHDDDFPLDILGTLPKKDGLLGLLGLVNGGEWWWMVVDGGGW